MLLLIGLDPLSSFATEQVYYYHNDALGSPVAMTDSTGSVVWQIDYEPFGDPAGIGGTAPNSHQFIGKEYDLDTGLYYFGARFYDGGIGRFLSVDPALLNGRPSSALKIPQSLNLYAYAINNPYRYLDRDGNWYYKVHQLSIQRTLKDVSPSDRRFLMDQQQEIDEAGGEPFKHAMRSPTQSREEAWEEANEYIRNEIIEAKELEASGQHENALKHVASAMHTMQDNTSPMHKGFQIWDDQAEASKKIEHVMGEIHPPFKGSDLDAATRRTWDLFKSNEPVPVEVLPRP